MQYVIVMSLAGSIWLLCYLIISYKKINFFSYKAMDMLLKNSLFFFLVPLFFLEYYYRETVYLLPSEIFRSDDGVYKIPYYFRRVDGEVRMNQAYDIQLKLFLFWLIVALIILTVRISRYMIQRKYFLAHSRKITEGAGRELLTKIQREYKIKRKITLYDTGTQAFTMGVLRPVICFDGSTDITEWEFIFRHECMHIKRLDVLTKQLANLVVCLHWFNPLVYLLTGWAEHISEICSDEITVKGKEKKECAFYSRMILQSMDKQVPPVQNCSALSKQGKKTEERLRVIMSQKQKTRMQKFMAGCVIGLVFFLDTLTVLAYPRVVELEPTEAETFNPDVETYFVEDGAKGPFDMPEYTILYDNQFVDEEGNIYPIYEEGINTCEVHTHRWVSGERQEHKVTADGGCKLILYECQQCLRCGIIQNEEWVNTITYVRCPH